MADNLDLEELLSKLNSAIINYETEHTEAQWDIINRLPIEHPELVRMADNLGEYPLHKA
jgi:hypothetical protein